MSFIFHNMNGSSFPLTNSYFSRWFFNHQPGIVYLSIFIYPLINIQTTNWKDPPFFWWVNQLFLWPFSIANGHTFPEATLCETSNDLPAEARFVALAANLDISYEVPWRLNVHYGGPNEALFHRCSRRFHDLTYRTYCNLLYPFIAFITSR